LDLSKYDVATVIAFKVAPGKDIDPLYGEKFAADVFGRLKNDFGPLFKEIRLGDPIGTPNEVIVTGYINKYSEGNRGLRSLNGAMPRLLLLGNADFDAELVLRDGATQEQIFTAPVHRYSDTGDEGMEEMTMEAAARVANTIARGRGWNPSGAQTK
jgi:hypothetical protein